MSGPVVVACVQVGNYQGQGAHYVNCLHGMVRRAIAVPFRFVCLTDDPGQLGDGIEARECPKEAFGWYAKLALFRSGEFLPGERVLYFDLDTVIVGNIDDYARYEGPFAGLGDFRKHRIFASGVMAWPGGFGADIWEKWLAADRPVLGGGDDEWIDRVHPEAVRIQRALPGIVSYKFHKCREGVPDGARIVVFQRHPKPHQLTSTWVAEYWRP